MIGLIERANKQSGQGAKKYLNDCRSPDETGPPQDKMKIEQVKINFVRLPLEEPLVGAPPMPGMLREFFTVQVLTDDGIEGIGITTFGGKLIRTLKAALDE